MNPTDPQHPWSRLVAAARRASDDRDTAAPYGFATRVAALAFTQERKMASLVERFALRAVGVASLLAILSLAVNYSALTSSSSATSSSDDELLPTQDAVSVVLDLS
jgi:hypothetical protein